MDNGFLDLGQGLKRREGQVSVIRTAQQGCELGQLRQPRQGRELGLERGKKTGPTDEDTEARPPHLFCKGQQDLIFIIEDIYAQRRDTEQGLISHE